MSQKPSIAKQNNQMIGKTSKTTAIGLFAAFLFFNPPSVCGDTGGEVYLTPPSAGDLVLRTFDNITDPGKLIGSYVQVYSASPDYPFPSLEKDIYSCDNNHFCLSANMVYYHINNAVKYFLILGLTFTELPFYAFVNVEYLDDLPFVLDAQFKPDYSLGDADNPKIPKDKRDVFLFSIPFYQGSFWIWESDFIVSLVGRYILFELLGYTSGFWDLVDDKELKFVEQMSYFFGADYSDSPEFSVDFMGRVLGRKIDLAEQGEFPFAELFWNLRESFIAKNKEEGRIVLGKILIRFFKELRPDQIDLSEESNSSFGETLLKNELKVSSGHYWNNIVENLELYGFVERGKIDRLNIGDEQSNTSSTETSTGQLPTDPYAQLGDPSTSLLPAEQPPEAETTSEDKSSGAGGCTLSSKNTLAGGHHLLTVTLTILFALMRRRESR